MNSSKDEPYSMVSYSSTTKLVTFARFVSPQAHLLILRLIPNPTLYNLNGDYLVLYDRMLLKIVSSFDALHFWFLLCPHNLRPLLRSRALIWAWSLLSTCSVINLMNKHWDIYFIQSTSADIFGLTVWRDAEGTCFYWVLCQICPLAAVMAAFY